MGYIHVAHIAALLSSCVSVGLIIWSRRWDGEVGALCVFCWTFSVVGSLLNLLVAVFQKSDKPKFCLNVPLTISSYAALFCLNTSIIFPHYYLKGQKYDEFYSHHIVAEIFSCIATLGHLVEVWIGWIESECYMATGPGLLQVSQTYVAIAIFFFLGNKVDLKAHPAVIWSLIVYCLCFVATFVSIMCCAFQNKHNRNWQIGFNPIAAIMYLSAVWPVFQLSQDLGQSAPPESGRDDLGIWLETRLIVVVALTALNFLLFLFGVCCFCMLRPNDDDDDDEGEHSTSPATSFLCPTRTSDETQALLPGYQSRALQYNNQTLNNKDLRIQQNTIHVNDLNIQFNIVNNCVLM